MNGHPVNGRSGLAGRMSTWASVDWSTAGKAAAAFLAGLVIVMGAALLWSRTHQISEAIPVRTLVKQPQAAVARNTPPAPVLNEVPPKQALAAPAHETAREVARQEALSSAEPSPPESGSDAAAVPAYTGNPPSNSTAETLPPVQKHAEAMDQPQPSRTANIHETKTKVITIQPGTKFFVRLADSLGTNHNRPGDAFRGTLASPIITNGTVIADSGASVFGWVVEAHKAPLLHGRADLSLSISKIETRDNGLLLIRTATWEEKGTHNNVVHTAKMATGAAVGAVVGAVTGAAEGAGFISGEQNRDRTKLMATRRTVVLPAGTEIVFALAAPLSVTERVESR